MTSGNYPVVNFFSAMKHAFEKYGLIISLAVYTETNAEGNKKQQQSNQI
jgi:hypothetical protein